MGATPAALRCNLRKRCEPRAQWMEQEATPYSCRHSYRTTSSDGQLRARVGRLGAAPPLGCCLSSPRAMQRSPPDDNQPTETSTLIPAEAPAAAASTPLLAQAPARVKAPARAGPARTASSWTKADSSARKRLNDRGCLDLGSIGRRTEILTQAIGRRTELLRRQAVTTILEEAGMRRARRHKRKLVLVGW